MNRYQQMRNNYQNNVEFSDGNFQRGYNTDFQDGRSQLYNNYGGHFIPPSSDADNDYPMQHSEDNMNYREINILRGQGSRPRRGEQISRNSKMYGGSRQTENMSFNRDMDDLPFTGNSRNMDMSFQYTDGPSQRNYFPRRPFKTDGQQAQGIWKNLGKDNTEPAMYTNIASNSGGFKTPAKNLKRKKPNKNGNVVNQQGGATSNEPVAKKSKEYVVQMTAPLVMPKKQLPAEEKKIVIDGMAKMVKKSNITTFIKCEICDLFFTSQELLQEHKESSRHISQLKGEIKVHIAAAKGYAKELQDLISPKEHTGQEITCCLCDKNHHDSKSHKWTLLHQIRLAEGPKEKTKPSEAGQNDENAESTMDAEADASESDLPGAKHVVLISGLYCKLCKKKLESRTAHCLSKKHKSHVQKVEEFKEKARQKRLAALEEVKKESVEVEKKVEESV